MTIFVVKLKYLNLNFMPNVIYDMCAKLLPLCRLIETLGTVACQAALSMGFSGKEYWSGLPCTSPTGSYKPKDQTQVSHTEGRFFTNSATREVQIEKKLFQDILNLSHINYLSPVNYLSHIT